MEVFAVLQPGFVFLSLADGTLWGLETGCIMDCSLKLQPALKVFPAQHLARGNILRKSEMSGDTLVRLLAASLFIEFNKAAEILCAKSQAK